MRMHLKEKRKKFHIKKSIVIISLFVFIILGFYIYKNTSHYYLEYSLKEARKIVNKSISDSINNEVLSIIKDKDLYKVIRNKSDEIEMIDYNSYLINTFLKKVSDTVSYNLSGEEENDINNSFYINLGSVFNNPILNDKGPKIPVKMKLIGAVKTSISTKVTSYGINNSLIEMKVHIEVKERILLPSTYKDINIDNDIPISYKLIKGKIPAYYSDNSYSSGSMYMMPVE